MIRSFIILRSREGLTFFKVDNSFIFSNEKKVQWSFPGCLFFENTRKNFKLNLVLVVVLLLESKGLYFGNNITECRPGYSAMHEPNLAD